MPNVKLKPWLVPNFARSDDEASIPFRIGDLTPEELDAQLDRFVADVRAKAKEQQRSKLANERQA